jgi:glycosyltransferase involved in cell wall biosynthesis
MHVGVLAHSWLEDAEGGGNRVAHDVARFLHGRGHRVTVIVPALTNTAVGEANADGIRLVRYEWAGAASSGLSRWQSHAREISQALGRVHGDEPFDVLHSHGVLQSGGALASRLTVPLVQTVHAPVKLEAPYRRAALDRLSLVRWKTHAGDAVLHRLEAFVLRAASQITCLSDFMLGEVERAHPWLQRSIRGKAQVIRGGTSLRTFAAGIGRDKARAALGWDDRPTIVAVRRLEPRMGLDLLLDAVAALKGCATVIAGRGSIESALRERCKALNLDDRVEFAGFVPADKLPYLYAAADVAVMPSLAAEGFGVSSIEAIASGTPVVATPIGANREITGSIDSRFVAAETTAPALATAIASALATQWDREELTRRAKQFDVDAVGAEYERVLHRAGRDQQMAAGA